MPDWSPWAVLILLVLPAWIFSIWTPARARRVRDYRIDLVHRVAKACETDVAHGHTSYKWRWDAFDAVSFDQMVYSWRSLDSFYPDRSFLEPLPSSKKEGA